MAVPELWLDEVPLETMEDVEIAATTLLVLAGCASDAVDLEEAVVLPEVEVDTVVAAAEAPVEPSVVAAELESVVCESDETAEGEAAPFGVVAAAESVVETPVPTTCLLGKTPSGSWKAVERAMNMAKTVTRYDSRSMMNERPYPRARVR